jgi:hypothetical protein
MSTGPFRSAFRPQPEANQQPVVTEQPFLHVFIPFVAKIVDSTESTEKKILCIDQRLARIENILRNIVAHFEIQIEPDTAPQSASENTDTCEF